MPANDGSAAPGTQHAAVRDAVLRGIAQGSLHPGDVLSLDDVVARTGASADTSAVPDPPPAQSRGHPEGSDRT